ncbi:glycosyltransferase, partial [Planktotalea sp.]|uniref:glycosyltransferase n=1 Tax=Planktotalea sp. TaxID=2029877 RepID=UPI003297B935
MLNDQRIGVVIPALNEALSIGQVIKEIPDFVDRIVVGDNGSTDATAEIAQAAGAEVVLAPQRGYGSACLAALEVLDDVDIVVFVDGDLSDYPTQASDIIEPILKG